MASIYILLAIFLWSSLGVVVRLSNAPLHILVFYSTLASIIIQACIIFLGRHRNMLSVLKTALRKPGFFLALGPIGLLNTLSFFYAFNNTTIANAVLTHYIAPILVAFTAPFILKEAVGKKVILAIIMSSAGLLIMLEGLSLEKANLLGVLSGILSGFSYAAIILIARFYAKDISPLPMVFCQNLIITLLLLPFIRDFPLNSMWLFFLMGAVYSTLAPFLYYKGIHDISASRTAALGYLEPVCAIFFSMLFLNEFPRIFSLLGGLLIILSGYITLKEG